MPTLNWIGKDKVVNHAHAVPFHVLEHKYNFGGESENKIIHGDNLLALKSLLPEYEGRVKCIYIDPPYNTGNEGWIYNDKVNSPQIKKWLGEVVGKEGEDLSRHDKWLCMMYPRLKLLKKLLADDGAIFISIDDNEQANLKLICDEIFGTQNFLAECSVKRSGGRQDSKFFAVVNEYLICYAKSETNFTAGGEIKLDEHYPKFDAEHGRHYKTQLLRKWGANSRRVDRPNLFYAIPAPDGSELYPMLSATNEGCWRWGQTKMREAIEDGLIEFVKRGGEWVAYEKIFQPVDGEERTKKFTTWIDDTTSGADAVKEVFGQAIFSYPKAVELVERVLKMCNVDKNAIVLDSFAGSGTTAHAVLNLNAQDGGNRKFILVEMEDYAETITAERVRRVIQGYGQTIGTGGSFDFYEVGEPLMIQGNLNENIDVEKINAYIWYTETNMQYKKPTGNNPAYLGDFNGTAIYFHYDRDQRTILDSAFLRSIQQRADNYLIYADECGLDEEFMLRNSITFKKIPRDIKRLWSDYL